MFISWLWSEVKSLSHVWLFATPWAVAHQATPSTGFSRQEYWSGLPFPSPGDLPDPGIELKSPALQADALPSEPPEQPMISWLRRVNLLERWIYQLSKGEIKLRVLFYFLSIYATMFMYYSWPAFLFFLTMSFFFFWPCFVECRILVPQTGIKPVPPAVEARSPEHWTLGSSQQIMS